MAVSRMPGRGKTLDDMSPRTLRATVSACAIRRRQKHGRKEAMATMSEIAPVDMLEEVYGGALPGA